MRECLLSLVENDEGRCGQQVARKGRFARPKNVPRIAVGWSGRPVNRAAAIRNGPGQSARSPPAGGGAGPARPGGVSARLGHPGRRVIAAGCASGRRRQAGRRFKAAFFFWPWRVFLFGAPHGRRVGRLVFSPGALRNRRGHRRVVLSCVPRSRRGSWRVFLLCAPCSRRVGGRVFFPGAPRSRRGARRVAWRGLFLRYVHVCPLLAVGILANPRRKRKGARVAGWACTQHREGQRRGVGASCAVWRGVCGGRRTGL